MEQRHGRGTDIAHAVLVTVEMDRVTRQVVFADGGLILGIPVTTDGRSAQSSRGACRGSGQYISSSSRISPSGP